MTYKELVGSIRRREFKPVYFLAGGESWFIDQITQMLEHEVLPVTERAFNMSVFYGKDANILDVISTAKRFPMMAQYQLVIVREAQGLKNIDRLASYLENTLSSTILVLAYKHGKPDGRTDFFRKVKKHAVYFESNELKDNQVVEWIFDYTAAKGIEIFPQAAMLLADHLGVELTRLSHEINKLCLGLSPGGQIDANLVEANTGISREFNVFELTRALARKNVFQANKIVNNLAASPRENPPVLILGTLTAFFSRVLALHSLGGQNDNKLAAAIGVNPYVITDYLLAAKNYLESSLIRIVGRLRVADLRLKGVDAPSDLKAGDILRELIYYILHE